MEHCIHRTSFRAVPAHRHSKSPLPLRLAQLRRCEYPCPAAATGEVVVGIDLGTSNSVVAHVTGDNKPRCIANAEGDTVTPSVVCIQPGGATVVGLPAKRLAVQHPDSTYYSVKRLIGRKFDDAVIKEEARRLAYELDRDEDGNVTLSCPHVSLGRLYPEQVSAQILEQLLRDAEGNLGAPVRKAVISVPAYFDDQQREATIEAGKIAGLETVRLIREPVAAALAYSLDLKEDQTVLVFDLGGGTYDISILEVGNGTIEVLSSGGDAHLGGDDFDAVIVDWVMKQHLRPNASSSSLDLTDPRLMANLKTLAEAAKMQLSGSQEVTLRLPLGGPSNAPLAIPFSRRLFDSLCEPLWLRCQLPLEQACWQAGVDLGQTMMAAGVKEQQLLTRGMPAARSQQMTQPEIRPKKRAPISKVLLVGGATRMPAVGRFLRNMTGLDALESDDVDPDEAVALGAAVQAGILQGQVGNLMVLDQWQASLMRALAQLKMREDPAARRAIEALYDMSEGDPASKDTASKDSGTENLDSDDSAGAVTRRSSVVSRPGKASGNASPSGRNEASPSGATVPVTAPAGGQRRSKISRGASSSDASGSGRVVPAASEVGASADGGGDDDGTDADDVAQKAGRPAAAAGKQAASRRRIVLQRRGKGA